MDKKRKVNIYNNFKVENRAEHKRRKQKTLEEGCREFADIQVYKKIRRLAENRLVIYANNAFNF